MRLRIFSYRYAQEILEHPNNVAGWNEIEDIVSKAPLFVYPGKSKNRRLQIVQQLMNTYFDRRFAVDKKWQFHPLATAIAGSSLAADYRKTFGTLTVQAEVQFGNMARWYSDIFKFQAAYSERLIQVGLSVVPIGAMARMTDSNVVNYERTVRELPSATLSITLPILLVGLEKDESTPVIDVTKCKFKSFKDIVGKGKTENRWRIIHGYMSGADMATIGPKSETGPMLVDDEEADEPSDENET